MTEKKDSIYQKLSKIDVNKYISKKMGLDYVSWANAWALAKAIYPTIKKKITEYPEYIPTQEGWKATGRTVDYRLTPFGCEVEVTVTIEDEEFSSNLYVMNNRGQTVDYKNLNYAMINKTQQRCLVKALANAGLGLSVYAGEDLPSDENEAPVKAKAHSRQRRPATKQENNKYTDDFLLRYTVKYPDDQGEEMSMASIYKMAVNTKGEYQKDVAKHAGDFLHKLITKPQKQEDIKVFELLTKKKLYEKAKEVANE